ncbi:MAG: ATP-dependent helicase UvrD/PcrA [Clostridiales bacterium]|jgi:DNA helicase-2/ATP-dependent DNA helicase PcrA|nr:ATP-dependent helicase UvrD/PcrA [Clostridiales bacterium]
MKLSGLNDVQKNAVEATDGPILVVAGAGSGKTRVLTNRIAHLIEVHDVFPSSILAITFTNKAASEMKSRIESLVGPVTTQMWVGTFHAICVRILRRDGEAIGYGRDFVIYDTTDQKSLIKACLKQLNIDEKRLPVKTCQYRISNAKNDMMTEVDYAKAFEGDYREKDFIKVYTMYQDRLKQNQALDFDDLLLKTIELFKKHPDILAGYQRRFKYIHVDEYQDTNRAQYTIVKLLSAAHRNLFVVGDGDQSIYRWRGADIRNIEEFEKDFPGAQVFKLEQNYRSTKNILGLANSVIQHNPRRRAKTLWTDAEDGEKIQYYQAYDEKDEARYVVTQIQKQMRDYDFKRSDFAVLYRTNAQSRAFEDMLMLEGIPYKVVGGLKFYERKEIKDVMAYLRLIVNPFDNIGFLRIINEPKRGIGAKTLEKLQEQAERHGGSMLEACRLPEGFSAKVTEEMREFYRIIDTLRTMAETHFVTQIFDELMALTGIIDLYEQEKNIEADGRIDNLYEFRAVIEEFEKRSEEGSLRDFLAETSLRSDQDSIEETEDTVLLMTLHASKGLEFPVVFLVGLEDQLFPSFRAMDDDEAMEEERRLCYVGITRAEKQLYVTHARNRNQYGRFEMRQPSCFLQEMDSKLMEGLDEGRVKSSSKSASKESASVSAFGIKAGRKSSGAALNIGIKKKPVPAAVQEPAPELGSKAGAYHPGDKVMHKVFGEGTIVTVGSDGLTLTIVFDAHGIKKLHADFAPIKVIKS